MTLPETIRLEGMEYRWRACPLCVERAGVALAEDPPNVELARVLVAKALPMHVHMRDAPPAVLPPEIVAEALDHGRSPLELAADVAPEVK